MVTDTTDLETSPVMQSSSNMSPGYSAAPSGSAGQQSPGSGKPQPTPPKTDKPRPHVCGTCARSFARLEHLKRHERSHTKEKPFECPECTRCFARRDLLLRHQQKLHMTSTPSSRPRAGSRRESTSSVATTGGRVRKNSVSNVTAPPMSNGDGGASTMRARPRANTIAHIDSSTLGMIANANANNGNANANGIGPRGRGGFSGGGPPVANMGPFAGFGSTRHDESRQPQIARIDTSITSLDLGGMMPRSASYVSSTFDDLEGMIFGNTINPAALHYNMSPLQQPLGSPTSPYGPPNFSGVDSTYYSVDDNNDDDYDWMNMLGNSLMGEPIDQSSPSAFSTTSASGISEVVLNEPVWSSAQMNPSTSAMSFPTDFTTPNFNDTPPPGTVPSQYSMGPQLSDNEYPDPLSMSPSTISQNFVGPYASTPTDHQNIPTVPLPNGYRTHSNTAGSVSDATRAALLALLSHKAFGTAAPHMPTRRQSNAAQHPPLSLSATKQNAINLPSTKDLQRYVDTYLNHFHPHLPFLHLPTLRFDPSTCTRNGQPSPAGSGCLLLSIAAVGALYESESQPAWELFEAAKKAVEIFLEERRKADVSAAVNGIHGSGSSGVDGGNPAVWLVQAMLLNVIFGVQCGDKHACEIAVGHCSTLVSLARAAGLTRPSAPNSHGQDGSDIHMSDLGLPNSFGGNISNDWSGLGIKVEDEGVEWANWIIAEERKRTLYAVHYLSSFLVAAHNLSPALMNNEIQLDLPCGEELWNAGTAGVWKKKGGLSGAARGSLNFSTALNELLSANERQRTNYDESKNFNHLEHGENPQYPAATIKPSTFGCLVLICALHVYIWESRQRDNARNWTSSEAEQMHQHIEPGLKAWQTAWYGNPEHSIQRPHPYGLGPLSADSIPLLDLAYIRLFVDLGRAKEYFWARDFEAMSEELARGWDNGQITPPSSASSISARSDSSFSNAISPASSPASGSPSPNLQPIKLEPGTVPQYTHPGARMTPAPNAGGSKREKHLRRAAFYAADSLAMSETLGVSDSNFFPLGRELPIQSALCTFDCAQVLAEWITTVQNRVGPYMGLLGSDNCNLDGIESMMILEGEDRKLLSKVMEMLHNAEAKIVMDANRKEHPFHVNSGLGPTVLRVSAYLLDKVVVWPATRLMAQALRAQADHMDARTRSILPLQN